MRIEQEPRRRPGERVDVFHPEYAQQQVEDGRKEFDSKLSDLSAKIEVLENPSAREILLGIIDLFTNIDQRIEPAESFMADKKEDAARERLRETKSALEENRRWVDESARKEVRFS